MFKQPVGYREFHEQEHFNFQLNRWLPYLPEKELYEVASKINNLVDWKLVMLSYAEKSESASELSHAAFYYRAAEFFMSNKDPDKKLAYDKFVSLFTRCIEDIPHRREEIPYQGGRLPAIVVEAEGEEVDTLVVHGGFDSFMEELLLQILPAREKGLRIIVFEGPGQGGALKRFNMAMPYNWEEPVAAILDYFKVIDCSLLGISLGGYLATRAAAFEPRIKRVIANDVMEDFFGCMEHRLGPAKARLLRTLLNLKLRSVVNIMLGAAAKKDIVTAWALEQGQHVSGTSSIYDYLKWTQSLNTRSISDKVKQDFLLLAGQSDHMVPLKQFYRQAESLVNVRSFTGRVFTDHEDAGSHCHVGNHGLVMELIVDWLLSRKRYSPDEHVVSSSAVNETV